MVAIRFNLQAIENGVRVGLRADTHILLAEVLNLDIDRDRLLQSVMLESIVANVGRGSHAQAAQRVAPS